RILDRRHSANSRHPGRIRPLPPTLQPQRTDRRVRRRAHDDCLNPQRRSRRHCRTTSSRSRSHHQMGKEPEMRRAVLVIAILAATLALTTLPAAEPTKRVPKFEPDPYWPKQLPNNWMLGQVGGIYVDSHDHIWVTSRPRTLDDNDLYLAAN